MVMSKLTYGEDRNRALGPFSVKRPLPAPLERDLLDRLAPSRGVLALPQLRRQVFGLTGIADGDHRDRGESVRDAEELAGARLVEAGHEMKGETQRGRLEREVFRREANVVLGP